MVTTRPTVDDHLHAGDGRSSSNLVVNTRLAGSAKAVDNFWSAPTAASGFVEWLAADDALHQIVMSQSSCLRSFLVIDWFSFLSLRRPSEKSETRNHDVGVCSSYYLNEVFALRHHFVSFIQLRTSLTTWPSNINNTIQDSMDGCRTSGGKIYRYSLVISSVIYFIATKKQSEITQ